MELELKNKSVLVTGSHRGTGQVIAESFASEGANVFFHSLTEPIEDLSANGKTVWGDITTESGADQVFQQVSTNSNHLDILVNNYGKAATGARATQRSNERMVVALERVEAAGRSRSRGRPADPQKTESEFCGRAHREEHRG